MYEIDRNEEAGGYLVHFVSSEPAGSMWVVRNRWHQDLGVIDSLGRSYRYEPHAEEPIWVGSGSVVLGVQRILALTDRPELREVPLFDPEAVTASAQRDPRSQLDSPETDTP